MWQVHYVTSVFAVELSGHTKKKGISVSYVNECFHIWCNYKTEWVPAQGLQMEINKWLKLSLEIIGFY